jgi:hypothetical protein
LTDPSNIITTRIFSHFLKIKKNKRFPIKVKKAKLNESQSENSLSIAKSDSNTNLILNSTAKNSLIDEENSNSDLLKTASQTNDPDTNGLPESNDSTKPTEATSSASLITSRKILKKSKQPSKGLTKNKVDNRQEEASLNSEAVSSKLNNSDKENQQKPQLNENENTNGDTAIANEESSHSKPAKSPTKKNKSPNKTTLSSPQGLGNYIQLINYLILIISISTRCNHDEKSLKKILCQTLIKNF